MTTGVPASLAVPPIARVVARELAALQGCEASTIGPSTLHFFWDLGEIFGRAGYAVFVDRGAYPIACWGMQRAAMRGGFMRRFNHFDPNSLSRLLCSDLCGRRPIVVCDGFCPGCGRPAPLKAYLELVTRLGGWLVIDDTQALGIFGHSPDRSRPYGKGGGGMPRFSHLARPRLAVVTSLAKAFGVPVAALSGSACFVRQFEQCSVTRVHCSPPSLAMLHTMARAFMINQSVGDSLRDRLARLVRRFRAALTAIGLTASGGVFPVQTLYLSPGIDTLDLHTQLRARGVSTVLHRGHERAAAISFLMNARHSVEEIDRAVGVMLYEITRARRLKERSRS